MRLSGDYKNKFLKHTKRAQNFYFIPNSQILYDLVIYFYSLQIVSEQILNTNFWIKKIYQFNSYPNFWALFMTAFKIMEFPQSTLKYFTK